MRKVSKLLAYFVLLLGFITLGIEPSFAEKESVAPDKSFKERKLEMFELELSALPGIRGLSWHVYFAGILK